MVAGTARRLDPNQRGLLTKLLIQQFSNKVVGQADATRVLVEMLENHRAGFCNKTRPIGNALFLGPTGTGKTHVVETFAESLFNNKKACIRIDCAEFQHSHEIAKLLGSPPGYLGHRETHPALTQEALNQYHTAALPITIVLLDEIEKASDTLWSLLLGILDNATLTLGDNRKVDFSKCMIVMTSNLGAREMAKNEIGFGTPDVEHAQEVLKVKAMSAVRSKFTPEFINRLQHIVMFQSLTEAQIEQILDMELVALAERLEAVSLKFSIVVSPSAKQKLLVEGYNVTYGARHLKRAIEKYIEHPLARLINTQQVEAGDTVIVDFTDGEDFEFYTHPQEVK